MSDRITLNEFKKIVGDDTIWSTKSDSYGIVLLYEWLWGSGEDIVYDDVYLWSSYMKKDEILKSKVKEIVIPLG